MKLIIDIDEKMYKRFAKAPRTTNFNECISDRNVFCKAIKQGVPLEDIKAEIENIDLVYEKYGRTTIMKNFDDIKSEIFDILDNHIKENK